MTTERHPECVTVPDKQNSAGRCRGCTYQAMLAAALRQLPTVVALVELDGLVRRVVHARPLDRVYRSNFVRCSMVSSRTRRGSVQSGRPTRQVWRATGRSTQCPVQLIAISRPNRREEQRKAGVAPETTRPRVGIEQAVATIEGPDHALDSVTAWNGGRESHR